MPLQNNAIHTQTKVDPTRLEDAAVKAAKAAVANSDGIAEIANELAAEPDAKCTGGGSKLIFVLRKNTTKRYFKKEMN